MARKIYLKSGYLILFLISFGFFLTHVAPHITSGDSAELALAGSTLGIAHSPGYPVFVLINKTLGGILILGNNAYRQNIASVLYLSFSLVLLGYLLFVITRRRLLIFSPGLLLFFPLFREMALTTEVFPLTLCFFSLLVLILFKFRHASFFIPLVSFVTGLSLSVHQTLILLIPVVLVTFIRSRSNRQNIRLYQSVITFILFFVLGLSINVFIFIRSFQQPFLDWEDPQTLARFWGLLTRARYGFFQLAQGETSRHFSLDPIKSAIFVTLKNVHQNIGWSGLLLVFIGTFYSLSFRRLRGALLFFWSVFLLFGPFFIWFAQGGGQVRGEIFTRFFLVPHVCIGLIMIMGINLLWFSRVRLYQISLVLLLAVFSFESIQKSPLKFRLPILNFTSYSAENSESLRWDLSVREEALNVFRSLPYESTLFSDRADETEFAIASMIGMDKKRPDLKFIDCNAGVTRSFYGTDYYRIWGQPRLQIREKIESDYIKHTSRNIYYATVDPRMVDVIRVPHGVLYHAYPPKEFRTDYIFPFHYLYSARFYPREIRSKGFHRTNQDLLGQYLFERGFSAGSLMCFGRVQMMGGPHRHESLGYWLQLQNQTPLAEKSYFNALASGYSSESIFSNFGTMKVGQGKIEDGIGLYQMGLIKNPTSLRLLYNLCVAYWNMEAWTHVAECLFKMRQIDPKSTEVLNIENSLRAKEKYIES